MVFSSGERKLRGTAPLPVMRGRRSGKVKVVFQEGEELRWVKEEGGSSVPTFIVI